MEITQPEWGEKITGINVLAVHCLACNQQEEVLPPADDWMRTLLPKERRAYELREQGLTHEQIGLKIGCSQPTVCRLLKSAEGKKNAAILRKLRETGGA